MQQQGGSACGGPLCPQLEPHLAQLLEQLCSLDPDVHERLFQQPEGEMMAVLNVLEPVV